MPQASQLSPELARGLLQLSRALLAAARNWSLYPSDHPTVAQSVARLGDAIRTSTGGAMLSIGVTPDTLIVEGAPADPSNATIAEAAALLHDRDLIQITFSGEVPVAALQTFLTILALDPGERRQRGGPAQIWSEQGHASLVLEQIDYQKLFEREQGEIAEPAKRDDVWRSIVQSLVTESHAVFDEVAQQRLLAIAGSALDIGDLATAAMAPKCTLDGSPMITTQAATVLATFRHLTSIVSAMAPERMPELLDNLADAAGRLDPHVTMRLLETEEDPTTPHAVVAPLTAAFDDVKVAQLLATALALEGQASDRLATIFNTIAPDEERKQRVLTLTRNLLSETDFGQAGQFQALWTSMEELLISYNDKPFVSEGYRASLDSAGERAARMAGGSLPPELPAWLESLAQENVRALSVTLLVDLLTLERDPARGADIARDLEALAEDLLMAGVYDDTARVTQVLAGRAGSREALASGACREALDRLGESMALVETAALIGDIDDSSWTTIRTVLMTVGAAAVEALKPLLLVEAPTPEFTRVSDVIVDFGRPAVARLAGLVDDQRWFVQRTGAVLLGRLAVPEAVPLLQPLLRKGDPRVARAAVAALGAINDPSAARAIHTVLRSAQGDLRGAVVDALVADRDPRVVPMLTQIIADSEPLGKDHQVVLDTLRALGSVGSDQAVPAVATLIRRRGLLGRRKLRVIKEQGVQTLTQIGGPRAQAALDEAATAGDRMLRRIAGAAKAGRAA